MNNLALSLMSTIIIGLGATLTTDLWALFLKHFFRITAPNYCLVGRWLLYMPEGIFRHSSITSTPQKSAECMVGWIGHYMIGVTFAIAFVAIVGNGWLQHPTLIPAVLFGIVTVLMPFFIMQPAFGFGLASSKTSNPTQARLRSLMNHTSFGIGLYLFGLLLNWLL
ncbi:MAG: DUF2938 domain-containing protein [Anaerolineales bacterium]|nr:DUF2938 domain-containing protein [Anaerolineales bacterium]